MNKDIDTIQDVIETLEGWYSSDLTGDTVYLKMAEMIKASIIKPDGLCNVCEIKKTEHAYEDLYKELEKQKTLNRRQAENMDNMFKSLEKERGLRVRYYDVLEKVAAAVNEANG